MDRRIRKTRKSLQDALIALLRRKPFDDVQIQEITDEADTARVTFYRHYGTKEELLLDIIESYYEYAQNLPLKPRMENLLNFQEESPIEIFFALVEKDKPLFKNLFTCKANTLLQKRMRELLNKRFIQSIENSPQFADLPIILIANHMATVCIGNVWWWLSEDLPYSAQYMAQLTHWMGLSGVMFMIGRSDDINMPSPDSWRLG